MTLCLGSVGAGSGKTAFLYERWNEPKAFGGLARS